MLKNKKKNAKKKDPTKKEKKEKKEISGIDPEISSLLDEVEKEVYGKVIGK